MQQISTGSLSKIGDLAQRYGVSLRTLRFYEEQGLLSPVRCGLERLYTKRDVIRLEIVLKGRKFGFSIVEIKKILDTRLPDVNCESIVEHYNPLQLSKAEVEAQISTLNDERNRIECAIGELQRAYQEK